MRNKGRTGSYKRGFFCFFLFFIKVNIVEKGKINSYTT